MSNNQAGVQNHSQPNKKFIIYSVFRNNRSYEENIKHLKGHRDFLEIGEQPHKILLGVYKSEEEFSIIRPYEKYILEAALDKKRFSQESVLILETYKHGLYKAKLHFKNNKEEDIGYFRCVSKEIAEKQDSYTIDGDNYYICTKSDSVMSDDLQKEGLK